MHGGSEMLMMVETCIDDMNPEFYGFLMERLFSDGALDVYWIPVQMKKNRPGILVQALCPIDKQGAVTARILSETTSLGVRAYAVQRISLARETVEIQTPFGVVAAKKVIEGDGVSRIIPEFDSCRQIARNQGIPLRRIYDAAAWRQRWHQWPKAGGNVLMDKQAVDKIMGRI